MSHGPSALAADDRIGGGGLLSVAPETYLFRWDGTAWVDTTPEETGVTVTSSVS